MNKSEQPSMYELTFWKHLAILLITVCVTNFGTAYTFSVSDEHIKKVIGESFTDTSQSKGLYKISGEPRVEKLEDAIKDIKSDIKIIMSTMSKIEGSIKNIEG